MKVYLATKYPRIGESVSRTFTNERVDLATNRVIYFEDLAWESHTKVNTLSNQYSDYPLVIHEHDLSKIKRKDPKKVKEPVDLKEFLDGVRESLSESWKGKIVKVVVHPEYKDELKKMVEAGEIRESSLLSARIMEKVVVNLDPFAFDEAIKDEEVKSLSDIRSKIKKLKEEQEVS